MGIENVQGSAALADPNRYGGVAPAPKKRAAKNRLDSDEGRRLHARLMNWFMQERDKQGPNRYQMAIDEDFYDGLQWTDEEMAELIARGQAPLVYNKVKQAINWMLGTERRTRVDGKVLPRNADDENEAEVKSKLLKYLSDVNRTPFKRSEAWKSCIVAGIGWMEDAINKDPSQELLATRFIDWKQCYHDSNAKEMDLSDGRFFFRWSFIDLDVAEALCPDRAAAIRSAAIDDAQVGIDEDDVWYLGGRVNSTTSGDYANVARRGMGGGFVNMGRDRVKIIECWYKIPVACKVCRADGEDGQEFHGEEWDPNNAGMVEAYQNGYMSVAQHVKMQVRVAVMTESVLLYEDKSPYKHDRFPFTPMWCYRRHRDGLPYGVIRDIRDAQIDYNKRASKALFILSTVRVVMDQGAVEDVDELRDEISRPDAVIEKRKGFELVIDQDKALAEEHIKLMMFDGQMIRDISGVTEQNLGQDSSSLSGKAIGKLQDQGSIVTAPIFDNMRLAIQMQTEIQLSLLEQFYTMPKIIRLVGENQPIDWLRINVWDEGAGKFINDITRSKADFIVDEQDFHASTRQAMFESMMELVGKLPPEAGMALLDMVIDFADVPNKTELVARIRKINGQSDPSRKPTPEEEKAKTDREARAAELEQVQVDTLKAQLSKTQAEAEAALAKVKQVDAEIQRIVADAVTKGVTAAYEALQAAQIVSTVPGVTPVADAILAGAGYKDQGGQDPDIPGPTGALPAMTPRPKNGVFVGEAAAPDAGAAPADMAPAPELQQADGAQAGIETPTVADGIQPQ
jgi:hypothetical protein